MVFKNSQAIMEEALATFVIGHLAKIWKIKLRVCSEDDPSTMLRFSVGQLPQTIPVSSDFPQIQWKLRNIGYTKQILATIFRIKGYHT